jgi:two-component system nitrate/nitrite response regulator NarL
VRQSRKLAIYDRKLWAATITVLGQVTTERHCHADRDRAISPRRTPNNVATTIASQPPKNGRGRVAGQNITVGLGSFEPIFSAGLVCVLSEDQALEVLEQGPGESLESILGHRAVDVALLDAADRSVLARLRERHPKTRVLVLAADLTDANATRHLGLGAGCLSRASSPQEIRDAIRLVAAAGRPFVWFGRQRLELCYPHDAPALTYRETEVLEQMCEGFLNKEIARELGISVRTVEVHVAGIRRKLGVGSKREILARLASTPSRATVDIKTPAG